MEKSQENINWKLEEAMAEPTFKTEVAEDKPSE